MNDIVYELNEIILQDLLDEVLETNGIGMKFLSRIATKDIILYGAGNLGIMGVNLLDKINIKPKYIVDKNSLSWCKTIKGVNIISPNEILEGDKENAVFAVCIVKFPFNGIKFFLESIGCKNILSFWDVSEYYKKTMRMTNGWYFENLLQNDKEKIRKVYMNLEDDISKAFYIQVLYWRINRQEILFENAKVNCDEMYFPKKIPYELNDSEYYIDCGAYIGDIIDSFINYVHGKFNKIIAFEPDPDNYSHLSKHVNGLDENISSKISTYQYGLGSKKEDSSFLSNRGMACRFINDQEMDDSNNINVHLEKMDDILKGERVTFIKIHAEGMEYDVLSGGLQTIIDNRPIVVLTIYHSSGGIMEVPLFLMENLSNYKFYHRLHSYCGNDSLLYAVPEERIK